MSDLTPGAALAKMISTKTPEDRELAQKDFNDANARYAEKAASQGISMTFNTSSSQNSNEKTGKPAEKS
jgi:hypothetical protein